MKQIKLVISDLDGTLLKQNTKNTYISNWEGKRVDEENTLAVAKLMNNDIKFAIATGRMKKQCNRALENIRFADLYFISQNGTYIEDPKGNIFSKTVFTKDESKKLLTWLLDHGFNPFISDYDSFYLNLNTINHNSSKYTLKYINDNDENIKGHIVDYSNIDYENIEFSNLGLEVHQITIDQMEDLENVLNEYLSFAETFITSDNSMDITPNNVDKSIAIKILAKHLNLDLDEIAFIGDSGNDRSALKCLKHSYVMDHARENVKCYARNVVSSVSEAINHILEFNKNIK